jgi:thiol-disulfide isomerase/thioredoxin
MPPVPPLPTGTPEELLKFVKDLRQSDVQPSSREDMITYMTGVAAVSVQAADKILAQVQPNDPLYADAAKLKLESLMMLDRLGDEAAAAAMAAYAKSLAASPVPELAREAERVLIVSEARQLFSAESVAGGDEVIRKTAALLAADPDDVKTAGLAAQLATAFEQIPGGDSTAIAAYEAFGPLFAKSTSSRIRQLGESFPGILRRLALPGKPMQITGTLLDGRPFDQKTLAGKVVLVDFWATWCGPCVAEIPNVMEQYEKYHTQGFEVVGISLDEDRAALEAFVAEQKVPWPILYEKPEGDGWQHPLAAYYGISGIPTVILIGRDGNVVTLNARGERLGEELAKLFPHAG